LWKSRANRKDGIWRPFRVDVGRYMSRLLAKGYAKDSKYQYRAVEYVRKESK